MVEPLPGVVVQSGGGHHGEDAGDLGRIEDLGAGHRIPAARGQRGRHGREILRVHADRTLTRVEVDRLLPVALDVAVGEHQRADGLVALVGVGLGLVDVLQHGQLSSGSGVVEAADLLPHRVRCRSRHHAGRRDRARIHQRVHLRRSRSGDRPDAFNRDNRVEPRPCGIDADALCDRARALLLDDLGHREDLGDGLDRHLALHVAGGVDLAVGGDQGDAEQVRIDLGERRNVVGVLAFVERPELRVGGVDRLLDVGGRLCARRHRQRERSETEQARPDRETPNTSTHCYPPLFKTGWQFDDRVVTLHFTFAFSQARTRRRPSSKIRS